jgi:uncharacterized membrane protein YjjP (DUF1212 family)
MPTSNQLAHIRSVLDLAVSLAEVLVSCGAGAEDAAISMCVIADTYGVVETESDITFTMLTLTWTDPRSHESVSRRQNVRQRGPDYMRLTAAGDLLADIIDGKLTPSAARARLVRISSAPPRYPQQLRRFGWALLGGGAALLLGGSAWIVAVTFIAVGLLDWVTTILSNRGAPIFFQCLAGGCIGPLAAAMAHIMDPTSSVWLVTVATIIMLLAGVTTLAAVQDLLSGLFVTGVARFTEAVVITVGIATGVVGTSKALGLAGIPLAVDADVNLSSTNLLRSALAAAVVVAGFSLATQVPPRAFGVVTTLGVVAELVYVLGTREAWGPVWSSASAALLVGASSSLAGRITGTPPIVIVVPALVPLVPGLLLFNGLMGLMSSSLDGLMEVLTGAAVAGALAAGALLGRYLVQWSPRLDQVRQPGGGPLMAISAPPGSHRRKAGPSPSQSVGD